VVACRAISSLSSKRDRYNVSKTLWLKLRQEERKIIFNLRYDTELHAEIQEANPTPWQSAKQR